MHGRPESVVDLQFDEVLTAEINKDRTGTVEPNLSWTDPIILMVSAIGLIHVGSDGIETMGVSRSAECAEGGFGHGGVLVGTPDR